MRDTKADMRTLRRLILCLVAALTAHGCGGDSGGGGGGGDSGPVPIPAVPLTALISLASEPAQANAECLGPEISGDGRYVAFLSVATNLVAGSSNLYPQVFLRDTHSERTVLASVSSGGDLGNFQSYAPAISYDGRYVAFSSDATNLAAGDTNSMYDIYVRDAVAGTTIRASLGASGAQGNNDAVDPAISADGRHVAFTSSATNLVAGDTNASSDVFVRDTVAGTTTRVSLTYSGTQANGHSSIPSISSDGRYVAFHSFGSNLVAGDTNASPDVFIRDMVGGTTTRVSVDSSEIQGNAFSLLASISSDGRYVAFFSYASNLVAGDTNTDPDAFIRDVVAGTTTRVSVDSQGAQAAGITVNAAISPDGRYVAFMSNASSLASGDTNGATDVFVRDMVAGTTSRCSVDSTGGQGDAGGTSPSISSDGRVAFASGSTNLVPGDTNGVVDIFVRDPAKSTTRRESIADAQGNLNSTKPSISADGRYIAFSSISSNLAPGDTNGAYDVFIRDTVAETTTRVSVSSAGVQGNGDSTDPSISADGRHIAFMSNSSNLVAGDTNALMDVFVRDVTAETTTRVSLDSSGATGNDHCAFPSISADGRFITFRSAASNLVTGDTNGAQDVFVRDSLVGTTVRASVDSSGVQGNNGSFISAITPDGRFVVFTSLASNLVAGDTNGVQDIFVRDLILGSTVLASVGSTGGQGGGHSYNSSISADGRQVAFQSSATNLVAGDANGADDVFVRDLAAGTTTRVSSGAAGVDGDAASFNPRISPDGRFVAFVSYAANLVTGDTNAELDAFVRDLAEGTTLRVSIGFSGAQSDGPCDLTSVSADGRYVAFSSSATNLVDGNTNGWGQVFVRGPLR